MGMTAGIKSTRRKSLLTRLDCEYLNRLMCKCQIEMMKYAAGGFKEEGLSDDQMVVMELLTLEKKLAEILAKLPERSKA